MTANINIQNKPVMPVAQVKPVLKAVDHQSKDIKDEQFSVRSVEATKAEKVEDSSQVNKIEKNAEENQDSEQALDSAVKQLNSYVQSINRNLEFNIDKDNGRTVVKVIDAETDELIRQIPNKEALQIAKHLDDDNPDSGIFLIKERA